MGSMSRHTNKTPRRLTRLAPGLTLCELSRRTGIRVEHLSRIFNGHRGLTLDNAAKVAGAIGVTIEAVHAVLIFPHTETPRKVSPPGRSTSPAISDSSSSAPVSCD